MLKQKLNLKTPKVLQDPLGELKNVGQRLLQFLFGFTLDWQTQNDVVKNNFDLGQKHFRLGNISDANFRFRIVTMLNPAHAEGWYYLGRSQLASGRRKQAVESLHKALKLKPGHEETLYMLAMAEQKAGGNLPKRTPAALTKEHFDAVADDFTAEQLERQKYKGHLLLNEAIRPNLIPGRVDYKVLDLGVGTGLCGALLRDVAAHITGVDISGVMLEQTGQLKDAQDKPIYDALIKRELHEYLQETAPESFDIVIAGIVVSYIGDLESLLKLVAKVMRGQGVFAFTADKMEGQGFRFDTQLGRFRFSKSYLQQLAAASGLGEVRLEESEVYPEQPMWLCVFRK